MKAFFKQIFKSNRWEHISQESLEMVDDGFISDFWIIAINFISTFLLGWGVGALAKADPTSTLETSSFVFGIITGSIFAFLACIKCYYEHRKQIKKQTLVNESTDNLVLEK